MASEGSDSSGGANGPEIGKLFDFGAMLEAMEVARRSWTSFSLPSSLAPTLDPAEVDKRIADLKTVEQWLSLNLNLVRGSVQALEIQRAALSSLHEFGAAAQAATQAASEAAAQSASRTNAHAAPSEPYSKPKPTTGRSAGDAPPPAGARDDAPGQAGAAAWPATDANAWWQMLQSQFRQVTESAMAGLQPGQMPVRPEDTPAPDRAADKPRARGATPRPAAKRRSAQAAGRGTATRSGRR